MQNQGTYLSLVRTRFETGTHGCPFRTGCATARLGSNKYVVKRGFKVGKRASSDHSVYSRMYIRLDTACDFIAAGNPV